jgi:hypothetical protein
MKAKSYYKGYPVPDIEGMEHENLMRKSGFILNDMKRVEREIKELTEQVEKRLNKEGKSLFQKKGG